jgi:hypothetical protein
MRCDLRVGTIHPTYYEAFIITTTTRSRFRNGTVVLQAWVRTRAAANIVAIPLVSLVDWRAVAASDSCLRMLCKFASFPKFYAGIQSYRPGNACQINESQIAVSSLLSVRFWNEV